MLNSTSFGCTLVDNVSVSRTTDCGRFNATGIFSSGEDKVVGRNVFNVDMLNFWLAADGMSGPDEGFTLDLGCEKVASGVRVQNTNDPGYVNPPHRSSTYHEDRATKRFRLLSTDNIEWGPWQTVLEGNLEDTRSVEKPPIKVLMFAGGPVLARYFKFELLEFWGRGGGLQHFAVLTGGDFMTQTLVKLASRQICTSISCRFMG